MAAGWTQRIGAWLRSLGPRLQYPALRLWVLVIGCFPIEVNLRTARLLGRLWWAVRPNHRDRAMANLRAALGDQYDEQQLRRIARGSFEHFAQLYLVELAMTPRVITAWSWPRYVELGTLGPALRELLSERGVIMLTAHFGNFELLGAMICRLGMPLTAVMRPVDDPKVNRYLVASREATGLTLLYKKGVMAVAGNVIKAGGALCFIADQDAGRKGLFVDFFGRKASTYKSIGLLAMQKQIPIIVGYAARTRKGFHYRLEVERIIQPEDWASQDDPLHWITQTYSHAMESAIRRYPDQYLWVHRRWKHQPRGRRGTSSGTTATKQTALAQ